MKPKRQKKYTTREMILKDIDKARKKYDKIMRQAGGEEDAMYLYKESDNPDWKKHADKLDELLAKAERLKNTRLKRLQSTLAQFDTKELGIPGHETLPAVLENL